MKKVSLKNNFLIRRILVSVIGTFIAALGIRCIVASTLGADAVSTFLLGVGHFLPLRFGTLSILFNTLILVLIYLLKRELIGLSSIINSFGLGIFLNLLEDFGILVSIPEQLHLVAVIIGPILFGIGTGIYLLTNSGTGAYECLMVLVIQKLHLSTKLGRILLDGSFMLAGFLLGGPVGIGTVIIILLLGLSLDMTMKYLPQWLNILKF